MDKRTLILLAVIVVAVISTAIAMIYLTPGSSAITGAATSSAGGQLPTMVGGC